MKKISMALLALILFSISSTNVNAYTTTEAEQTAKAQKLLQNGSNELVALYEEQNFIMGDEWFDENGNLIPTQVLDVKYVETSTYISSAGEQYNQQTEREITANEYQNWAPKQTRAACSPGVYTDCWETTAKRLFIAYQTYPTERVQIINQWKTMPSVRSYDTIGVVFDYYDMTNAWGYQWYNTSSNTNPQTINYSYGGSNMKISNSGQKGVSISQDLVDNAYTTLQNDLYMTGTKQNYTRMAASYQHAVKNINLNTSKAFSFDPWGMGKVFNWNTSWSNWDNMQGVCFNWSPYLWTC